MGFNFIVKTFGMSLNYFKQGRKRSIIIKYALYSDWTKDKCLGFQYLQISSNSLWFHNCVDKIAMVSQPLDF